MKLYIYDHCPYCVKARMIFGLKNINFELVTLLNDDEETPISMVGQKMLPILEKPDGSHMPESLDIIDYIDQNSEFGGSLVGPSKQDPNLDQWLSDSREYVYSLAMPRWTQMPLEEFATQGAINYFTFKKEKMIGPFEEALKNSSILMKKAKEHLAILESMIEGDKSFWNSGLSIDDFHVFAVLRCLTTVKGLDFPPMLDAYMNLMSDKSKVVLHWDMAIGES